MSRYAPRMFRGPGSNNVVLIIEDEKHLLNNLSYLFELEQIRAIPAEDGLTGLTLLRQHRPKVVVLDMYVPHISGFEIIDEIRADSDLRHAFVIAITGMAEDAEDLRGMKGSADLIMAKPLDEQRLLDLVRAALDTAESAVGLRRRVLS